MQNLYTQIEIQLIGILTVNEYVPYAVDSLLWLS